MSADYRKLLTMLGQLRVRWIQLASFQSATRALAGTLAVWLAVASAAWIVDPPDAMALLLVVAAVGFSVAFSAWMLWPLRIWPNHLQMARLVEERYPTLENRLVCAAEIGGVGGERWHEAVVRDALEHAVNLDLDRVVSRRAIRRAALTTLSAATCLALVGYLTRDLLLRSFEVGKIYAGLTSTLLQVHPGHARILAGHSIKFELRDQVRRSRDGALLKITLGNQTRSVWMNATPSGTFEYNVTRVSDSFRYHVTVGTRRSPEYEVTVLRPPRVQRVDLHYTYPAFTGLPARWEKDGGDIYAPVGTRVRIRVNASKSVKAGELVLSEGGRIALTPSAARTLEGDLSITHEAAYRIALADHDGLQSAGETEYFIRTVDDRPPQVRITLPMGDQQVTTLEEVRIAARADDDYGVEQLELVYAVRGGAERTVRFQDVRPAASVEATHLLYVEDLGVAPGDFITYYARARDVSRGKRSTEARSDIFFLEVRPFEEEFAAAQTQAGRSGGGNRSLDDLTTAQKEIVIATWKLDRRARGGKSIADIRAIAKAQADVKTRAQQLAAQLRFGALRRQSGDLRPSNPPSGGAMGKAAEAMGRAQSELELAKTTTALPHEMEALNELLKARAEVRRREVARQQANGGGGSNRDSADLSALFDRELQRRQQTNYETPPETEKTDQTPESEALEKLRELARRQDDLNRQQQELDRQRASLSPEELKRQLERLTREQSELRLETEQLARQLARAEQTRQPGQQRPGSQQSSSKSREHSSSQDLGGQNAQRRLQEISEEMRAASSELRQQSPRQASERGSRALAKLRELERQLDSARPDERGRALGDFLFETRQAADEQRRLMREGERLGAVQAGNAGPAAQRLSSDKDRLADRVERLQERLEKFARDRRNEQALGDAASDLKRQQVAEHLRQSARTLREQGVAPDLQKERDLARALDQLAIRIGDIGAMRGADTQQIANDLARAQELRENLARLQRELETSAARETTARQSGRTESGARGESVGGQAANETSRLQDEYQRQMKEARELLERMRRQAAGRGGWGGTPEDPRTSVYSAPGTESFKQDFSKWDTLRRGVMQALEQAERTLSDRLREKETRDRLRAAEQDEPPAEYRRLVDQYFQSLARQRP